MTHNMRGFILMQAERTSRGYGVAPDGRDFVWGPIKDVHTIGDFSILEYEAQRASNVREEDWKPHNQFSLYLRDDVAPAADFATTGWRSTSHSYHSLDAALLAGICWKHEERSWGWNTAANSKAHLYASRMIGLKFP